MEVDIVEREDMLTYKSIGAGQVFRHTIGGDGYYLKCLDNETGNYFSVDVETGIVSDCFRNETLVTIIPNAITTTTDRVTV